MEDKIEYNNENIESRMTDYSLFKLLDNKELLNTKKNIIEYVLNVYGTKERCNRFDIGNCIEFIFAELLRESDLEIKELPNAKRVDIHIENYGSLSIKYSSIGDITLHNSNSCINKDLTFTDTILLTLDKIFLYNK